MTHFLVHIVTGMENPTRATLGFLIAKTAIEAGHQLSIFVAGDGVNLLRREVVEGLVGLGTGELASHIAALGQSKAGIFYSGLSAKARGLTPDVLALPQAQPALPTKLVELAAAADVVLTY